MFVFIVLPVTVCTVGYINFVYFVGTVLGSLLFKCNSLHITLYFECITVTYYFGTSILDITFTQSYTYKNEASLASMQNFSKIKVVQL